MRHFVGHVLAESQPTRVDTDLQQELRYTGNKVTEGLVGNDTSVNSIANGDSCQIRLARRLRTTRSNADFNVSDLGEFFVALVEGVRKMLDFCHGELTNAQQACSW
jgi:hypothetical protein